MGCGGSKQGGNTRPGGTTNLQLAKGKPGVHVVWGDYLSSDTRGILATFKLVNIPHEFHLVDTLKGENKQDSYIQQSYCDIIPMVSNDHFKVIGGDQALVKYSKNAFPEVRKDLYSEGMEADIDRYIGWFYSKMRPDTQRLIRMIVLPKVVSTVAVK